jgi:hypothetical protein
VSVSAPASVASMTQKVDMDMKAGDAQAEAADTKEEKGSETPANGSTYVGQSLDKVLALAEDKGGRKSSTPSSLLAQILGFKFAFYQV